MTQSGHHISRWNDSYSSRLAGAAFVARHPRYSVAVGGEDGSRVSPGASSKMALRGFLGTHAEEKREIIGTRYLRSAEENFVREENRNALAVLGIALSSERYHANR